MPFNTISVLWRGTLHEDDLLENVIRFYSVWPSLVCVGIVLIFAWSPIGRFADLPPSNQARRIVTMDGLRGFLALAVVLHHVAIYHMFLQETSLTSDRWGAPPSRFYATVGPAGVSIFFMITGYLFWTRLIQEQGKPDWGSLYVGRVFRIGPLYLAALAMASVLDHLSKTAVPATSAVKQLATWSLLGLSIYKDWHEFLAGVTWSIQDEWLFYISLPVLALFLSRSKRHLAFSALLLSLPLFLVAANIHHAASEPLKTHLMRAALFFAGMVCASLHRAGLKSKLADWLASCLVTSSILLVFVFPDVFRPIPLILLGVAFFLIASGCSLWGLLRSRAAIRLGDISYGIYLLQGLIMAAIFRPGALREFALSSPAHHWELALAVVVMVVVAAMAAHLLIERPGIALGRRVAAAYRARQV